jgi:hypothetical protein
MAGMGRYFVLVIDGIDFLVGVVHENVFGAFLDALHGTFFRACVGSFGAALAVRDVSGPTAIARHCQNAGEKCDRHSHCSETYFHKVSPSQDVTLSNRSSRARWLALPSSSLYYAFSRKMDEMQKGREDSLESSLCALT